MKCAFAGAAFPLTALRAPAGARPRELACVLVRLSLSAHLSWLKSDLLQLLSPCAQNSHQDVLILEPYGPEPSADSAELSPFCTPIFLLVSGIDTFVEFKKKVNSPQ